MSIPERLPDPMCAGSFAQAADESANPAVGWGECPVCGQGFYVPAPAAADTKVTVPRHPKPRRRRKR